VTKPNDLVEIGVQRGDLRAKRAIMHLLREMGMPQLALIVGNMDVPRYLKVMDAEADHG
jgi:hypothetical protein